MGGSVARAKAGAKQKISQLAGAGLVPQRLGQGLQCGVLLLGEPREALEFGEVHLTCFAAFAGGR